MVPDSRALICIPHTVIATAQKAAKHVNHNSILKDFMSRMSLIVCAKVLCRAVKRAGPSKKV